MRKSILNPYNPLGRSFIAGTRFIGRIVTVNRPMNRTLATAFSRNGLSGLKLLWAVAALMLCTTVSAVGMGGINVASALGQPLKADIDLLAVSKAEKSSLVARLASPDAYKSAGLEYPFGNKFKFQIESRADGEPYLTVSSAQPINDPFVTMLVELTWASGKLLREYTFLLDPIGYVPAQPAQAAVRVVAPAVQVAASEVPAASAETAPASEVPIVTVETLAASEAPAAPAEATAKPAVVEPMTGSVTTGSIAIPANKEWLVVKRGDTMTKIAAQYKLADISLERMLVALYRANVDEFDGKNMNRIRAGKILQLPTQAELESVTQPVAKKEIRAQAADWNVYRQKLASAAAVSRESQPAQQVATGKISSSVTDQAPVAKESAKEVLKLSKGEAPGDRAATGAGGTAVSAQDQKKAAQDKKNAAQEEAIATAKSAKEEQMRTAMLEHNIKAMEEVAKLKAELAQAQAKTQAQAQAPVEVASKVVVATPLAVAKPESKPAPVNQEPSLVDQMRDLLNQILGEPLYLAGAAAALLILGGLALMLQRRKKKPFFDDAGESDLAGTSGDAGSMSGRMTAPVEPSPDTGDFTRLPGDRAEAPSQTDNVDPISEADLFLSFGRDAQAEEILKEALKSTPKKHQIHLKLLGIYANRKDVNSFSAIARTLQDSGDEYAWQEAVAMGRALEPNNPMYGGAGSKENIGAAQQTTVLNATPASADTPAKQAPGLDFDFDLGALTGKAAPSPEQNFLGDAGKTVILSAGDMAVMQQPTTMDFDVTAASPAINLDELIFDVTGSRPAMPAAQPEVSKPAPVDDGAMEFTIDFPVKDIVGKPAPAAQAAEIGLAGISLNFEDAAAPSSSSAEVRDDHWQEVATKLDLAKAYQEMGDADGVREILAEVLNEGDAEQQEAAKTMLKQLG